MEVALNLRESVIITKLIFGDWNEVHMCGSLTFLFEASTKVAVSDE